MDYNTFMQFFRELRDDAQGTLPFVPDYTHHIETIKNGMNSLVISINTIATSLEKVAEPILETEAIRALQKENAKLVASVTDKEQQLSQMRALVHDLSVSCIGCKKEPWHPHNVGCSWYHANEKLLEALNVKDSGEAESAS